MYPAWSGGGGGGGGGGGVCVCSSKTDMQDNTNQNSELNFNPGLVLTHLWTTGPRYQISFVGRVLNNRPHVCSSPAINLLYLNCNCCHSSLIITLLLKLVYLILSLLFFALSWKIAHLPPPWPGGISIPEFAKMLSHIYQDFVGSTPKWIIFDGYSRWKLLIYIHLLDLTSAAAESQVRFLPDRFANEPILYLYLIYSKIIIYVQQNLIKIMWNKQTYY
jgi:hypothetical protein